VSFYKKLLSLRMGDGQTMTGCISTFVELWPVKSRRKMRNESENGGHAVDFGHGSGNGMHCDYHGIQTALQEELELRCGGADINRV